jgi:hypothetical protein
MSGTAEPATAPVPGPYDLLLLAPGDDVAVAVRDLAAGQWRTSDGRVLRTTVPIALGHKVAVRDIAPAEHVVRSGMSIGSATAPVSAGDWVHVHNLASDYIVTFADRGGQA